MPQMPGTMSKGRILHDLDDLLSDPVQRDDLLADLNRVPVVDLVRLAVLHGLVARGSPEEAHLRDEWFGPNWWPSVPPADRQSIVRAALQLAIQESARRGDLNIDCYWICQPRGERIEASVSWSEQQVTLCLYTPPPPAMGAGVGDPIEMVYFNQAHKLVRHDGLTDQEILI